MGYGSVQRSYGGMLTEVATRITYTRETLSPALAGEMMPHFVNHFDEVGIFKDIPLDPDWELYFQAQEADKLRIYIARDEASALVGYSVYFLGTHPHHKGSKQARHDIFFIPKDRRGFGLEFLIWCGAKLKTEGYVVEYMHISEKYDWSSMAKRAGFEKVETIWAKRLD